MLHQRHHQPIHRVVDTDQYHQLARAECGHQIPIMQQTETRVGVPPTSVPTGDLPYDVQLPLVHSNQTPNYDRCKRPLTMRRSALDLPYKQHHQYREPLIVLLAKPVQSGAMFCEHDHGTLIQAPHHHNPHGVSPVNTADEPTSRGRYHKLRYLFHHRKFQCQVHACAALILSNSNGAQFTLATSKSQDSTSIKVQTNPCPWLSTWHPHSSQIQLALSYSNFDLTFACHALPLFQWLSTSAQLCLLESGCE